MKKTISTILVMVLAFMCLSACNTMQKSSINNNEDEVKKLSIVTTIFPQFDFTHQIVGTNADVTMLLKPGAESHSYEPTPQDIKLIQNADLFIYTGGENDAWVDDILNSMGDQRPDTLRLVDCVDTVNEEIIEGMEHEHEVIIESEIDDRPLQDFNGNFKSIYPFFEAGELDDYIKLEASEHEKSFDEMKQLLIEKRKTDFDEFLIKDNTITLKSLSKTIRANYKYNGFKLVLDDDGDIIGVWYTYELEDSVPGAYKYLIFNDHNIGPRSNSEQHDELYHLHVRYGDESVDALIDNNKWTPTYYPAETTINAIKTAMLEHNHQHEDEIDEHVWTSPKNAIKIVEKITSLLSAKDQKNADDYLKNSINYIKELERLDNSFRTVLNDANRKTLLFGDRFPFRYFADEYGLDYYAAFSGCSTESEASAATVAFLIDKVKEERLPVVFAIELSNGKIADSISEATGAKKLTLYSCHNVTKDQLERGATYLSMMQENLESLKIALE